MSKPELWSLERLRGADLGQVVVWIRPNLKSKVYAKLRLPQVEDIEEAPDKLDTLIAIGGGVLMDRAKVWRKEKKPNLKLVCIPSIWGSGAENSPVAVINEGTKKVIRIGEDYLADVRVIWPELARGVTDELIKYACGDVWAHSLEGFWSPIAEPPVRSELASIIKQLEVLPFSYNPLWFELSAAACRGQARSSVGLVHGIAHTLEGRLKQKYPDEYFGHARLCASYLWQVYCFNRHHSDKVDTLFKQYDIEPEIVTRKLKQLYEDEFYNLTLPVLKENWSAVLREATSRTNCVLVRPQHLDYFYTKGFR